MNNLILFLVIFLIIAFFFASLNFILKRNTENYGVFCGRYNLHRRDAKKNCIKDSNCKWKNFKDSSTNKIVSWCSDNPSNATIASKISSIKSSIEEQLSPTWVFESSSDLWMTPIQNTLIGDWSTTNVKNSAIMSVSFWINISELNPYYRNIFHVSNQNKDCCDIGNRVPAMWICPSSSKLTVGADISTNGNASPGCSLSNTLNTNIFITLVFNTTTMVLYANAESQQTYTYSSPIVSANSDAQFYISDPWYVSTGYQIKDFSLYDFALSSNEVKMIYNEAKNNS